MGVKASPSNKKETAELVPCSRLLTSRGDSVPSSACFLYLEQAIEPCIDRPFAFIVELKPISPRHMLAERSNEVGLNYFYAYFPEYLYFSQNLKKIYNIKKRGGGAKNECYQGNKHNEREPTFLKCCPTEMSSRL